MNLYRYTALALFIAFLATDVMAALVVEPAEPGVRKVGGWTIGAGVTNNTVTAASAKEQPQVDAQPKKQKQALAPTKTRSYRLVSIPDSLADTTIHVEASGERIEGSVESADDQMFYVTESSSVVEGDEGLDAISTGVSGNTHYAFIVSRSSVETPRSTSKMSALRSAAERFESIGGNLDQRIAAIYAANQQLIDGREYTSGTWLSVPSAGTRFNEANARRINNELTEFGSAELDALPPVLRVDRGPSVQDEPLMFSDTSPTHETEMNGCGNFDFQAGLLKENIARFLGRCGYTIGQWRFGDAEYEYDMEIGKSYVYVDHGLEVLIKMIAETYLVQGTINTLDKTVDFEPARGNVLDGMEIEKW